MASDRQFELLLLAVGQFSDRNMGADAEPDPIEIISGWLAQRPISRASTRIQL